MNVNSLGPAPKILFRCDASSQIGGGHVMRCMTLAEGVAAKGWDCHFAVGGESLQCVPALGRAPYAVHDELFEMPCDWLVVDHYGLDAGYENAARRFARKILVIDDLANRSHDADILIDQTFGRDPADYSALVPSGCRVMTGATYALLRPQFAKAHAAAMARERTGVGRILLAAGLTNLHRVTDRLLAGLLALPEPRIDIDVVVSAVTATNPYFCDLLSRAALEGRHAVRVHTDVIDMAGLMLQADLAVGCGGTTSWERCCMGLPSLVTVVADNQRVITAQLAAAGCVVDLGWYADIKDYDIVSAVEEFRINPRKLEIFSQSAVKICDGHGLQHAIEAMSDV